MSEVFEVCCCSEESRDFARRAGVMSNGCERYADALYG